MIGSIGLFLQSAVTLYIYRVGKTYPARNPVFRSKSIKNSNCTWTSPRPVGPTGQTGWSCQTVYRHLDRSDRLDTPVRPVCSGYCQFWSSTYAPLFFGKACVPKNTSLDQNCLRATISNASAIYSLNMPK